MVGGVSASSTNITPSLSLFSNMVCKAPLAQTMACAETNPAGSWPVVKRPDFAKRQVELLVTEGFDRREAERLFACKAK